MHICLEIKPQFRDEVKIMVQTLLNPRALHPKVINGKEVTCKKFVEIIKVKINLKISYKHHI